jgi:hypothetical protein
MEGKIFKSSVILSVGFMKFKVFDETYIWFIGFGKGLTGILYKMFFRTNAEFLLN